MVKLSRRSYKGGSGYTSASSYGEYVGAQGQWSGQPNTPNASNLSLIQSAGKRRKKRGGFLPVGEIINQAAVPFALLGLQQTYRRKKRGGRKSCKKRTRSRRR